MRDGLASWATARAERWVRSVTEAYRSRLIRCGEAALSHALTQSMGHVHQESTHQGKGKL
jgi:hypothetical protein